FLFRSLVHKLLRRSDTRSQPVFKPPEMETVKAVLPAVQYINFHFAENVNVDKLAGQCFMSVRTFTRLFRKAFGKSPYEYVTNLRINFARLSLSSTDTPITNIAFSSGFKTLSNFNKSFRKSTGFAPRNYRKNQVLKK
ncbi:MAG: AraC family transcriptional regulator, partial [Chitinivibrionales bacterium]|nr:AraC family transcriptional regulator [Chitinivibrionales bacterium]